MKINANEQYVQYNSYTNVTLLFPIPLFCGHEKKWSPVLPTLVDIILRPHIDILSQMFPV